MKIIKNIYKIIPLLAIWINLPAFLSWIFFSAGIYFGKLSADNFLIFYNNFLVIAIIILVIFAIIIHISFLRIFLFFIAGFLLINYHYGIQKNEYGLVEKVTPNNKKEKIFLSGKTIGICQQVYGKYYFTVKCDSVYLKNKSFALKNKHIVCYYNYPINPNSKITATGKFYFPRPQKNPGGFDEYLYFISNSIWGKFYCDTVYYLSYKKSLFEKFSFYVRSKIYNAISQIKSYDASAIISAAFLNDRSMLTLETKRLFYQTGIFHLLAISGFHVSVLAAAIYFFLMLFPIPRNTKILLTLLFIWLYLFFIGLIPSLFRAVLMTTIFMLSYFFQKKSNSLNSIGIAGIIWLLFSPFSLFTPSYQLSFSATFGILAVFPKLLELFNFNHNSKTISSKIINPLFNIFLISFSAFITTLPFLTYHFGSISTYGVISNIFAVPLMSISLWSALLGFIIQFVCECLCILPLTISNICIKLMLICADFISLLPYSLINIPRFSLLTYLIYCIFLVLFCLFSEKHFKKYFLTASFLTLLSIGIVSFIQYIFDKPQIVFFNANRSNITGIKFPNKNIWLLLINLKDNYSLIQKIIKDWLKINPFAKLDGIVINQDPCNYVLAIDTILKSNKNIKIISYNKISPECYYFSDFLKEFDASFINFSEDKIFIPSPGCTIAFIKNDSANQDNIFDYYVSIYGNRIILSDTIYNNNPKGAMIISYKNKIDISYIIPPNYPFIAK